MGLLRRRKDKDTPRTPTFLDEPSKINPLASRENAETFGTAYGVAEALGQDPILYGAAAWYAKAEEEERAAKKKPHPPGAPPSGAKRAGE